MATAPGNSKSRGLLGPGIAFAGVLVSAAIGYASWHNGSIQQEASMVSNFYERSGDEEAFWKGLYDDYLATFDERFEQRPAWRKARLIAIFELAGTREIPSFEEYSVPFPRRAYVKQRLTEIRSSLYNGLEEQAENDRDLQNELIRRGFGSNKPKNSEPPLATAEIVAPAATPPAAPAITAAISTPVAVNSALTAPAGDDAKDYSPPSDSGWDLDIFWCRGALANENYQRADVLATEFGALARAGRALAPGVRLGRVRARPASIAYQQLPKSAAVRPWVIADRGAGEAEAAAAVRVSANTLLGRELIGAGTSTGRPTKWYLSLFLCGLS